MTCANFQVLEPGLGAATATVFTPAEINFPYDDTDELRLDIYNYQSEQWVNVPFATGAVIDVGGAGDRFYAWNLTTTNGQRGVTTIIATAGTTPALPAGATASHPLAPEAGTDYPVFGGARVNVRLYRQTSIASGEMPAIFYPGASIRAEDLNDNFEALRKVVEEAACSTNNLTDGAAQLDARYWNKIDVDLSGNTYTTASTSAWPSNDTTIATTGAGDDRWLQIPGTGSGGTTLTGGNGIDITGTTISVDLATNSGLEFDSNQLAVEANGGLVRDGSGLNVGAGTGINVNADDVAVNQVTIWGRNHNHGANVSGDMSSVGNISFQSGDRSLSTAATTDRLTITGGTGAGDEVLKINRDIDLVSTATTGFGAHTYTWPTAALSANTVLTTDASGNLSWTDGSSQAGNLWELSGTDTRLKSATNDILFRPGNLIKIQGTDDTPTTRTINIQAPSGDANFTANYSLTLPPNNGSDGEVLQTDGSGVLSWASPASSTVWSRSGTTIEPTNAGDTVTVTNSSNTATITLNANGGGNFSGPIVVDRNAGLDDDTGCLVVDSGGTNVARINDDGSAEFAQNVTISKDSSPSNAFGLTVHNNTSSSNRATVFARNHDASGNVWLGHSSTGDKTSRIGSNGNAQFTGELLLNKVSAATSAKFAVNGIATVVADTIATEPTDGTEFVVAAFGGTGNSPIWIDVYVNCNNSPNNGGGMYKLAANCRGSGNNVSSAVVELIEETAGGGTNTPVKGVFKSKVQDNKIVLTFTPSATSSRPHNFKTVLTSNNGNLRVFGLSSVSTGSTTNVSFVDIKAETVIVGDADNANILLNADGSASFKPSGDGVNIDSSGRLLVGTTSDSGNVTLVLQGNAGGANNTPTLKFLRNFTPTTNGHSIGSLTFNNVDGGQGAEITAFADGAWTNGTSHPTRFVFKTTASGATSATERLQITNNGTIKLLNSPGIDFSGISSSSSSATVDNNILDDYEEGTWTPQLSRVNASGFTKTDGNKQGNYTKIGRLVTATLKYSTTAVDGGTGSYIITGLPFQPSDSGVADNYPGAIVNVGNLSIRLRILPIRLFCAKKQCSNRAS